MSIGELPSTGSPVRTLIGIPCSKDMFSEDFPSLHVSVAAVLLLADESDFPARWAGPCVPGRGMGVAWQWRGRGVLAERSLPPAPSQGPA